LSAASRRRAAGKPVIGIKSVLIVNLPLLGIAKNVVCLLDILESFFRRFVTRIQVRMVLARKLAVSLADIIRRRLPFHPECFVIFVLGSRHSDREVGESEAEEVRINAPHLGRILTS
jgi:hypothetical protein